MIKVSNRERKEQKGFSIVEIMAVVAILGALATTAIPFVVSYQEQKKLNIDNSNAKEIEAAILINVAKGVVSLQDEPASIAEIVLKELGSIPEPQQEGYGFYYCDKTGDVKALKIGCERESFKRLKQP